MGTDVVTYLAARRCAKRDKDKGRRNNGVLFVGIKDLAVGGEVRVVATFISYQ